MPSDDKSVPQSWTRKLSPEAKRAVHAAAAEQGAVAEGGDEVDVLVRTTRELSADERATLRSVGATVRTVAGDVSTVRVPVGGLEALARLDLVAYVELSRPMRREASLGAEERSSGEPGPPG